MSVTPAVSSGGDGSTEANAAADCFSLKFTWGITKDGDYWVGRGTNSVKKATCSFANMLGKPKTIGSGKLSGVVNRYAMLTGTYSKGHHNTMTLKVGSKRDEIAVWKKYDLVIVMQMQDFKGGGKTVGVYEWSVHAHRAAPAAQRHARGEGERKGKREGVAGLSTHVALAVVCVCGTMRMHGVAAAAGVRAFWLSRCWPPTPMAAATPRHAHVHVHRNMIQSVTTSGQIKLAVPLKHTYVSGKPNAVHNSQVSQVIRVPYYIELAADNFGGGDGGVSAVPWDGETGGVVAIKTVNKMVAGGMISASCAGYRGGLQHSSACGECALPWRSIPRPAPNKKKLRAGAAALASLAVAQNARPACMPGDP